MISDKDRSYYIGASDTKYVMGNWNTQTFRNWWDIKMGFTYSDMDNIYLRAGTLYEPKILDAIQIKDRNRQIIIGRLRVNLDGETDTSVIEIKTFQNKGLWTPTKAYQEQVQVELFATNKNHGYLYGYALNPEDYEAVERGETIPIDEKRIMSMRIVRDDEWLDNEYLPRLWYLCECLEEEKLPCMDIWLQTKKN